MPDRSAERGPQSGQAAAELLAVLPLLIVCALALAQVAMIGWAQWTAANAARAGARAALVGGDPSSAALSAIQAPLRGEVRSGRGGSVRVKVQPPGVIPGAAPAPALATATMSPGDG